MVLEDIISINMYVSHNYRDFFMILINFYHMQQIQKAITMYGPRSPFTKVLLNSITSSIGNFITHDWQTLEKATASHYSTLAWKIPWTGEPGRLQSMGSLRADHD